jgi:Flp pilus assembly protein TadD
MKFATLFFTPLMLASTCLQAQGNAAPAIDEAAYLRQADLALRSGRLIQAGQMIAWLESNGADNAQDDIALLRAEYAIANRDVEGAATAVAAIGNSSKNMCRLNSAKGWVHANRQAHDEAIVALANAARACPDDAGVWNLLGLVLIGKGESDAAAEAFGRAGALAPDDVGILNNHALALLQRGDVELAMQQLDRAVTASPENIVLAENRDFVSGMLGRSPARYPGESDAEFAKRLVNHAQGAKASANGSQAQALFSQALLTMDRFDQRIWLQLDRQETSR